MEAADGPDHLMDAMTYAVETFNAKAHPMVNSRVVERDRGTVRDPTAFRLRRNFCREIAEQWRKAHPPTKEERLVEAMFEQYQKSAPDIAKDLALSGQSTVCVKWDSHDAMIQTKIITREEACASDWFVPKAINAQFKYSTIASSASREEREKVYLSWDGHTSFLRYWGNLVTKQPYFGIMPSKQEDTMRLFEFAAYFIPTEKGEKAAIVVPPTTVLAKTEDQAKVLAGRAIPEAYADQLDKVTIVVRPFV